MRSLLAIPVGAVVVAVFMSKARSGIPELGTPTPVPAWLLYWGSLALIAFLVGFTVTRRGWLAASGAYVAGVALFVLVDLRPTPPWVPTDARGSWEAVIGMLSIGAPWSAVGGAAGSWVARARARVSRTGDTRR